MPKIARNTLATDLKPIGRVVVDRDGVALYDADFLTKADADHTLSELVRNIGWKQEQIKLFGRLHKVPRLSAWFSETKQAYTYSGIRHEPVDFPPSIRYLRDCVQARTNLPFNCALANLYVDGAHSNGWHADDEPELGSQINVASISLGATRTFRLRHRDPRSREIVKCELEHGSLLLMLDPMQKYWLHELPKRRGVTKPRVNLTFRNIPA